MAQGETLFISAKEGRALLDGLQRHTIDGLHRLQRHMHKLLDTTPVSADNPLCFFAETCQRTHPGLMWSGDQRRVHKDADASISSPLLLGVADGVESLEEYGIDAAELPRELLECCAELAMDQLTPDQLVGTSGYEGPVELLKEAYETTESLGSTTIALAIMDNQSRVHGTIQPMLAVLTVGDCELVVLRRVESQQNPLKVVFHTGADRARESGAEQAPIQVARVDADIDPEFNEGVAIEVIERASEVSCVSVCEHDIVLLGSDGVFDNLFLEEIVDICNDFMPCPHPGDVSPVQPMCLRKIAQRIVLQSHAKAKPKRGGKWLDAPIGKGGKMDDTTVVVAEILEWTDDVGRAWKYRNSWWNRLFQSFVPVPVDVFCHPSESDSDAEDEERSRLLVNM